MSASTSRVILITGASSGIGRSCAIALSNAFPSSSHPESLVLVLSGRRQGELEVTAKECREGTTTELCVGDVSKDEDVIAMFEVVKRKYGRVDLVFNNAGVDLLNSIPIEEADMAKFRQVLEVNVMAAVLVTKEATKIMKEQQPQGGRIINNGSISSTSPRPSESKDTIHTNTTDSTAYTVSKHAITGLTRSTSLDGRKYGITCTQLDIGNAQTAMGGHAAKGCRQADGSIKPEPMMDVENVGKTIIFLAGLDRGADVLHMELIASGMPFIGRG